MLHFWESKPDLYEQFEFSDETRMIVIINSSNIVGPTHFILKLDDNQGLISLIF